MAHEAHNTNTNTNKTQTQRIASTDYGKWDAFDAGENGICLISDSISIDGFDLNNSRYGMFENRCS